MKNIDSVGQAVSLQEPIRFGPRKESGTLQNNPGTEGEEIRYGPRRNLVAGHNIVDLEAVEKAEGPTDIAGGKFGGHAISKDLDNGL